MLNQDKATLIERLDVAGAHKSQMAGALFGVLLLTHAVSLHRSRRNLT